MRSAKNFLKQLISKRWLGGLYHPPARSRKSDNGTMLIIAGSKKYHGSLVLCATMAAKIVDLVYVATTSGNFAIIKKLRHKLAEFIFMSESELRAAIFSVEVVLIGPGMLPNAAAKRLVNGILKKYPQKKTVLDAAALRVADLKLLHSNCVLTPHAGELAAAFHQPATPDNVRLLSKKYPAVFVLKGPVDYVCQGGRVYYNTTGNAGMTKGGTGDVLAGLIAALAAKNDVLMAACAGVYVNGLAGDCLKKRFGLYYSASELIPEIQRILGTRDKRLN